jgi:hypothetical protein
MRRTDKEKTEMTNKSFSQVYEATESLCKTATNGNDGQETTLADWMQEGDWQNMTPEQMAAEWDELSEQ